MTSAVTIASNALLMLAHKPISAFDEDNNGARIAANLWPSVRDSVLRRHPWNCAIKRVTLAPDADPPDFEWPYQFTLPGDCLRVLSVGEEGCRLDYKREGRKILSDTNALQLRYVFRNEDAETYDSMLVDLLTLTMAHRMAYGVTQSAALVQSLGEALRALATPARAVDGLEDTQEALSDAPLLRARYIGR